MSPRRYKSHFAGKAWRESCIAEMVKREFVSSGSGGRDEIERPQEVADRRALRSHYFNLKSIIHGIYLSILYFLFLSYVFDIFPGLFATMCSFEFWKFVILCLVAEKVNRIVWFFCPRIELFVVILCLVAEKRDFFCGDWVMLSIYFSYRSCICLLKLYLMSIKYELFRPPLYNMQINNIMWQSRSRISLTKDHHIIFFFLPLYCFHIWVRTRIKHFTKDE